MIAYQRSPPRTGKVGRKGPNIFQASRRRNYFQRHRIKKFSRVIYLFRVCIFAEDDPALLSEQNLFLIIRSPYFSYTYFILNKNADWASNFPSHKSFLSSVESFPPRSVITYPLYEIQQLFENVFSTSSSSSHDPRYGHTRLITS